MGDTAVPSNSEQPFREGFDPNAAVTWNAEEHAAYETGYREGSSDVMADWNGAKEAADLDEQMGMYSAASRLARYEKALRDIVACDYRGNQPNEQRIAKEALGD